MILQQRNMATLKEIQLRLRSVQNIGKITKSMKMIAQTKMTKAQRLMEVARIYGETSNEFFTHAETTASEVKAPLAIAISSDRGLCGSIHSSVTKAIKAYLKTAPETSIIVLGLKCKAQLNRDNKELIALHFESVAKNQPNWTEAANVADSILKLGKEFDGVSIFYNKFKSVIAFETTRLPVYTVGTIEASR
ncbi:atp3 gamma subunit of the F1 sector of mitochondrial F1F0 ATP synthase, partial [Nowakowskiella sp. JEL0078]